MKTRKNEQAKPHKAKQNTKQNTKESVSTTKGQVGLPFYVVLVLASLLVCTWFTEVQVIHDVNPCCCFIVSHLCLALFGAAGYSQKFLVCLAIRQLGLWHCCRHDFHESKVIKGDHFTCSISFWGTQSMPRTWKRPFCTTFGTYERMDLYGVFRVFSIMRMKTTNKQQRRCSSLHDLHGSRSKTHARHLVSEWHLQIWMCIFASVAKDSERAAKGSRKVWIHLLDYRCVWYCIHAWQLYNHWAIFSSFSQIGMGFSIGTETPAHPLIKIIL